MAEDHDRPYRSTESIARTGQTRGSSGGSDPLAELARLIGQNDPFGDVMNASSTQLRHEQPYAAPAQNYTPPTQNYAQQNYPQQNYPAHAYAQPQDTGHYRQVQREVPAYLTARGPAPAAEPPLYHPGEDQFAAEQHEFYDEVPPRRRLGVLAIAAIFGLAAMGTVGAFGYRTLFGSSGTRVPPVITADKSPLKVVPSNAGGEGRKAIADRVSSDPLEKVLPREEKPVDIAQKIAETTPPIQPSAPPMASAGNGVIAGEPKKVHTITIRPDGTEEPQTAMASPMPPLPSAPPPLAQKPQPAPVSMSVAPPRPAPASKPVAEPAASRAQAAQASANAPLSLNPNAAEPASRPVRTANAAAAAASPAPAAAPVGHSVAYAVQVSSQKSEAEAKAAYKGLESKYSAQLSGKPMFVYRVDLGSKGIYYRTMVGPYADASEATQLCSSLKSAGGSCIVQRN